MKDKALEALLDSVGPDTGPDADDLDPRWEALALGELDEASAQRLAALGAASRRGADLAAAFEPLGDDFAQRTTERLLRLRPAEPAPVVLAAPAAPPRASLWERLRWPRLRLPLLMVPVLVAAMALLVVTPRPPADLPAYAAELRMGDQASRGAPTATAVPVVSVGSKVDVVARPATPVDGPVAVGVFQIVDGQPRELALDVTVAAGGVVRVRGVVGQHVAATPGPVELRIVVQGGARAPAPDDALAPSAVPVRFEVVAR